MSTAPGQVELSGQALRLVEHDDPCHPVVALATQRIEELSARRGAADERVAQLQAARPTAPTAQEIEALLDSVPGLRAAMRQAPPDELSELFAAFDLTATYDKDQRALRLAATLSPDLVPPSERPRPPKKAVTIKPRAPAAAQAQRRACR
ncbi:hypothetical protein Gocc_1249 [Gaiella occulta]|uniref:Uncharacterized protein n=1 Tax=Gaiella occulta TaxID=1002870 RepID=A0A7M2Z0V9_9ACTN|nr:hypothetical protein [Gaiella occulta]RDI75451.1 hypothetical protein Gocc_1249 [Gaiella occulta]